MAIFYKLEEFFDLYQDFGQESHEQGFSKAEQELWDTILEYFSEIKLDFPDGEDETKGDQIDDFIGAPVVELITINSLVVSELALTIRPLLTSTG